ncbi:Lrp/AsnC family transcriptional regulator [Candidatus Bathyarchaeota archaeon]|nr:Lrp/AsnC family transcriptional regulator [Candidatus Bathyarchaeota archaeon]
MNEKDEAIIRVLGRRSGLSSRALSKMLNIPISTVHRRIKKLEQEGTILGYKALINFEKTTWPIGALLLINLAETILGKGHIPKKDVLRSLRNFREIEEIIEVQAVDFDLVIRARFQSLRKLSDFIEELRYVEGIEEASSAIITEEAVLPPPFIN